MYRTEAETSARLPPTVPAPRLRFTAQVGGWFVAAFENIAGRHPRLDQPTELAATLSALERMAQVLTPSPLENVPTIADAYGSEFMCWRKFAEHGPPPDLDRWCMEHLDRLAQLESQWCEPAAGHTLLHTDIRPDNLLLTDVGTVVVVDWAWPCVGASWVELASMAPSIAVCGVNPDPILAEHPATRGTEPAAISAFICALLGYWTRNSREPPPPRSPNLRRYQARTARVTREWLRNRIGWG
ncbi:phosphotransferase [Nocardia sp. GP40]